MKYLLALIAVLALSMTAQAQSTTTLVDQLQSYLNYERAETAEECPGGGCYHYYRAARLTKQLAAAQAAAAAGTPLAPIMNAWGVAPIWDANGIAIPGTGASGPSGSGSSAGRVGALGHNSR